MSGTTPIKRHQALLSFSRDHHFGLLLVWKIKQGLDNAVSPDRISDYVLYFFEQDLQQHFREEEELLFPKLPADNALRQRAEREHAIIYGLVAQLRFDTTNEALLWRFANTLKDHIRFEERELFVAIQQQLGDAAAAIAAAHDKKRSAQADKEWQDRFWEIKKKIVNHGYQCTNQNKRHPKRKGRCIGCHR
jgi:Hemerythrin HHE cation binding domain.